MKIINQYLEEAWPFGRQSNDEFSDYETVESVLKNKPILFISHRYRESPWVDWETTNRIFLPTKLIGYNEYFKLRKLPKNLEISKVRWWSGYIQDDELQIEHDVLYDKSKTIATIKNIEKELQNDIKYMLMSKKETKEDGEEYNGEEYELIEKYIFNADVKYIVKYIQSNEKKFVLHEINVSLKKQSKVLNKGFNAPFKSYQHDYTSYFMI